MGILGAEPIKIGIGLVDVVSEFMLRTVYFIKNMAK